MAVKIGSNISSLQAQRRLGEATSSLGKTYEKLSSGQRINRASDDAAGLAIASELSVKGRILGQAIRNLNDGISAVSIASASMKSLKDITERQLELATQSASGTLGPIQRRALQKEADALTLEANRILAATTFNGISLFDVAHTSGTVRLQLGIGAEGSLGVGLGDGVAQDMGTGSCVMMTDHTALGAFHAIDSGDFNNDGRLDLILGRQGVILNQGDGTFQNTAVLPGGLLFRVTTGDYDQDGFLDVVATQAETTMFRFYKGKGDGSFEPATPLISGVNPAWSQAVASMETADFNGDGFLDVSVTGGPASSMFYGDGHGGFVRSAPIGTGKSAAGYLDSNNTADAITVAGATVQVKLGSTSGSFTDGAVLTTASNVNDAIIFDYNRDGYNDVVVATASSGIIGFAGRGDGTFESSVSLGSATANQIRAIDSDADGLIDIGMLNSTTREVSIACGTHTGSFAPALRAYTFGSVDSIRPHLTFGDFTGDGALDVTVSNGGPTLEIAKQSTRKIAELDFIDITTAARARASVDRLSLTRESFMKEDSSLGASLSRLQSAMNEMYAKKDEFGAANSRILDADVAQESAVLVRTQILQQAGAAVLAQANQAPALALTLLR